MTPHKQLFHHQPEAGVFGDCYRTCIGSLLDLRPEEVPHEHRLFEDGEMRRFMDRFLAPRGLALMFMAFNCEPADIMAVMAVANPGMFYLLSGTSRTGCNHVVIARDDQIVHDPSLTDAGIIGRCSDGHTYVEWLVPRLLIASETAEGEMSLSAKDLALRTTLPPPVKEAEPEVLHPRTRDLVDRFAAAVAEKLSQAERKYGYSDGWADPAWQEECRRQLHHHAAKGDPRDVAAYCAFCWHHGWPTTLPATPPALQARPTFEDWLSTLEEDVVEGEYGYEPGEFTLFPEHWRQAWEDGLTPSAAFRRACEAATESRKAQEAVDAANALRIKAEDRAAIAESALQARVEALEGAVAGIADDYMTSEKHHPGYVLIPVAKFEQLRRATLQGQQS